MSSLSSSTILQPAYDFGEARDGAIFTFTYNMEKVEADRLCGVLLHSAKRHLVPLYYVGMGLRVDKLDNLPKVYVALRALQNFPAHMTIAMVDCTDVVAQCSAQDIAKSIRTVCGSNGCLSGERRAWPDTVGLSVAWNARYNSQTSYKFPNAGGIFGSVRFLREKMEWISSTFGERRPCTPFHDRGGGGLVNMPNSDQRCWHHAALNDTNFKIDVHAKIMLNVVGLSERTVLYSSKLNAWFSSEFSTIPCFIHSSGKSGKRCVPQLAKVNHCAKGGQEQGTRGGARRLQGWSRMPGRMAQIQCLVGSGVYSCHDQSIDGEPYHSKVLQTLRDKVESANVFLRATAGS